MNRLVVKDSFCTLALFLVFTFSLCFSSLAQNVNNKAKQGKVEKITDPQISSLVGKIETYTFKIDRNNFQLQKSFDLTVVEQNLPSIEERLKKSKKLFDQNAQKMNIRSLNSVVILMGEITDNLNSYKKIVDTYSRQLKESNDEIKKILKDPDLKVLVTDSVINDQLQHLISEGKDLDTLEMRALSKLGLWGNRISVCLLQNNDIISDIN